MPIAKFQMPDGRIAKFEVPEGTTPEQAQAQIMQMVQGMPAPQAGLSERLGQEWGRYDEMLPIARASSIIKDIPRAAGVAGRNIIEGLGGTLEFLGTPLKMAAEGLTGKQVSSASLADALGLPKPSGPTERIVSEAEKVLAGGSGLLGLAGKAAPATSYAAAKATEQGSRLAPALQTTAGTLEAMAARPGMQAASMLGAGLGGGTVKEAGGGPLSQLGGAVMGGLLAPATLATGQRAVTAAKSMIKPGANIETTVNSVLTAKGLNPSDVAVSVKKQLAKDMEQAMKQGKLDQDMARRLVDYRLVGATPTAGPISLDPGVITRQKNLAALGASSKDPKLQALSQVARGNVEKLTDQLNALGASSTDDAYTAGTKMVNAMEKVIAKKKSAIDPLWKTAKDQSGRSAQLDPAFFTRKADDMLGEELLRGSLPADVRGILNDVAQGKIPFTVEVAEQLKTRLFKLQKPLANYGTDAGTKNAINTVRRALEETPLLEVNGKEALSAFNAARAASREWLSQVEKTPALAAVREGVEPDKFMQSFIIGAGKDSSVSAVRKLKTVIKDDPAAIGVVKNYITRFLKDKATAGAPDELGKFSQSAYNNALKSIGDAKLRVFFEPEEINMLRAIGRVASYEQAQPTGSAVNNSRTAAAAISGILDTVGSSQIIRRIPFGSQLAADPAKSIAQNIEASQLLTPAVTTPIAKQPAGMVGAIPLLAGGISAENSP